VSLDLPIPPDIFMIESISRKSFLVRGRNVDQSGQNQIRIMTVLGLLDANDKSVD